MDDDVLDEKLSAYIDVLNREGAGSATEKAVFAELSRNDERARRIMSAARFLKELFTLSSGPSSASAS